MAAGTIHIPFYATTFRADDLEEALVKIAPIVLRYEATHFMVERSKEDSYRFILHATFESKTDFQTCWYGPEWTDWRARFSGYYQVPVNYEWWTRAIEGGIPDEPVEASATVEGNELA